MKRTLTTLSLSALLLSSCLLGPDYLGPQDTALPETWVNALPPGTDAYTLTRWWQSFNDPQLAGLIETAFTANPDMITAALSISKAESALRSTQSGLFPEWVSTWAAPTAAASTPPSPMVAGAADSPPPGRRISGAAPAAR